MAGARGAIGAIFKSIVVARCTVPVEILRGKLLYPRYLVSVRSADPLCAGLALGLFGIKLNTLYVMGMILVISSALLIFEIGRNFELPLPAAMAPAIFFLAESFPSGIFQFCIPIQLCGFDGCGVSDSPVSFSQ